MARQRPPVQLDLLLVRMIAQAEALLREDEVSQQQAQTATDLRVLLGLLQQAAPERLPREQVERAEKLLARLELRHSLAGLVPTRQ